MLNSDIIDIYEGLQKLREGASKPLPARISFAIIRNLKTLQPIVEAIQTTYSELLAKYADPIEGENNRFKVKDGCLDILNQEMTNLYSLDTEVPLIKIKFSEIENLHFSLNEIDALYFMIEDGET